MAITTRDQWKVKRRHWRDVTNQTDPFNLSGDTCPLIHHVVANSTSVC